MSDNIDYAELDKAVNEAMLTQPSKPVSAAPARRPAPRPQNRGHIMDFAPRGAVQPMKPRKAATKPAARPVITRPMTRKIVQQNPTTSNIPQRSTIKPASRIATMRRVPEIEERPVAPAAPRPSVAAKIQQKQQRVATAAPKPKEAPKEAPKPKAKKVEAPDANSYSLGGRSPFLTDAKVEKRPLGTDIPESSASTVRSTRNVYSQKNPTKAPVSKRKKHTVTEAPKTHSGWLWTLVVLLVIAAGAGLGYLAYIIIFANQL